MKLALDPVWPWSEWRWLSENLGPTSLLVLFSLGMLFLLLPLWFFRLNQNRQKYSVLVIASLLALVLPWIAIDLHRSGLSLPFRLMLAAGIELLLLPLGLAGWMLATYQSFPGNRLQRLSLLGLRLSALLCALSTVVRPHFSLMDSAAGASGIIKVLVDGSGSMSIQDESGQARWDVLVRVIRECQPLITQLRKERGLDFEFYRFGKETTSWDIENPGQPTDKRTDIAGGLETLLQNQSQKPARGLILFSDGRHNGTSRSTPLAIAHQWGRKSSLHTVILGNPNTPYGLRDVAVARLTPNSSTVQSRTRMTLQAQIDAPGFEGSQARLRVFVKGPKDSAPVDRSAEAQIEFLERTGEESSYKNSDGKPITLRNARNNQIRIQMPAPDEKGEYTVSLRAEDPNRPDQPLPGEVNRTNNETGTLISVIPGGIRVLMVDRPRAWEPQMVYDVLRNDPRINIRMVWLGGNKPAESDIFQLASQQYDVIILGDVTASQMEQAQPGVVKELAALVNRGSGLIMLGGYASFGNNDWKGTPIDPLLPVDLSLSRGLIERPIRMMPTESGRRLLSLANGDAASEEKTWKELPSLEQGIWKIAARGGQLDTILATSLSGDPILVSQNVGKGRVLAFAVDTTYFWRDTPEGVRNHSRFWKQIVTWLAHLDDAAGNIWVRPDQRDIAEGGSFGFQVGARSKGGIDLPNGVYEVDIETPGKKIIRVNTSLQGNEQRGTFKPQETGEYIIRVKGKARDPGGNDINDSAEAHFLVHEEDVEMAEWSADKGLMERLAREGKGRSIGIFQLPDLLRDYLNSPIEEGNIRRISWPDWRSKDPSGFLPLFVLLFVSLLTLEWYLRRRWGLV